MKLSDLAPNPKNPRTVTKEKLSQLEKSLLAYGSLDGFVYNTKLKMLVGGHRRQSIFKEAKIIKVKGTDHGYVIWRDEKFPYREVSWNLEKHKAATLAANTHAGEFDLEIVSEWMQDLKTANFDLDLTMFDLEERKVFLPNELETKDVEETSDDPEDIIPPIPLKPKTKPLQQFKIGEHFVHCGDSFEFMKGLKENSVDSIVTDPPYGWRFMGKAWDGEDIQKKVDETGKGEHNVAFGNWSRDWAKEALRILKPGGHALVFCGPRTYHRMASGVEDAGFEIRDQLQWLFGSGFPKSLNLGNGFGTALKPANEPILLARKPLSEKTVAANVLKWGTGGLNIDGCRIGTQNSKTKNASNKLNYGGTLEGGGAFGGWDGEYKIETRGRFPANLILDEEAAKMLDEQSGNRPGMSGGGKHRVDSTSGMFGKIDGNDSHIRNDTGGASRFFYVAKTSKAERNAGLEETEERTVYHDGRKAVSEMPAQRHSIKNQNFHPTVKPVRLMQYLCRLITPVNGIILEPFLGSGTTIVAAEREGMKVIGSELDPAHCDIILKRAEKATGKKAIKINGSSKIRKNR